MKKLYDKILERYNSDDYKNYREQESVIEKVFSDKSVFEKANEEKEILQAVLLRVVVLDSFYSTNLAKFGIYEVAEHITKLESQKIHQKIRSATPHNYDELKDIIEQIAKCKRKDSKKKIFYSFATKYCFHHNQNAFRIYDSFVREVLVFFNNKRNKSNTKFEDISREFGELVGTNFFGAKLTNTELKDYKNYDTFLQAIDAFAKHYGLANESAQHRRDLDHFLWILGKEQIRIKSGAKIINRK
ncbi:hypothetical protein ACRE1S_07740 [Helicobacter himalayensis]|uniref:hypothetical protein n=1 Tax=Helicobacter himalayensis TaxID=1591088 RepID=UPI003D6EB209